jgi:hypothetical protein
MASFWHLPIPHTETPHINWLGARKAPPPANMPKEGIVLGRSIYRGHEQIVRMKRSDRRRHLYVIGKSGGGKSVFIENLAVQDVQNGEGVCVIDPHGDFVEYVLQHIPKERADDVIYFNPSDIERPIGLNMLEVKTEEQKDFATQEMISIFYKMVTDPSMIGPMFEHNMRNVMLTLMSDLENPGTVAEIPRMFSDDTFVKQWMKKLNIRRFHKYRRVDIPGTTLVVNLFIRIVLFILCFGFRVFFICSLHRHFESLSLSIHPHI